MNNIGRILKYNPWIDDTHTRYMWSAFNLHDKWGAVIWMSESIKNKIREELKAKK